jgi:HD-GYP domain-containing protein (c-di-GMP phosphodiesterase class II)
MPHAMPRTPASPFAARHRLIAGQQTQPALLGSIYLMLALAPLGLAVQRMPSPGLAVLLYAALAVWAELLMVPPAYAGWPSPLLPLLTLILLDAGLPYVLPIALLALGVRSVRRRVVQRDHWPWPLLLYEAGTWLLVTAGGVAAAESVDATWRSGPWRNALSDNAYGVPGLLLTVLAWSLAVTLACLIAGSLGARLAGYRRQDLALRRRLRESMIRAVVCAILVYTVVGVCMAFVGPQGTYIVVAAVAITLVALWWQARGRQRRQAMLIGLAELAEAKDATTGTHLVAVAGRTTRVAAALGLPAATVDAYANGALLHDAGKLAVPTSILTKPGRLDEAEWAEMRTHTTTGRALLRVLPGCATAALIAGHHHERWDGSGYPDGLAGAAIPLAARIVSVVDAFDAMTADRPYHRGIPVEEAGVELRRQRGRQFDPAVVDAFDRALSGPERLPLWRYFPLSDY